MKYVENLTKEQLAKYKTESRQKLLDFCSTAIKTTMIGSIAILEENLSDLEYEQVFNKLRKQILDLGNEQIARIQDEFERYTVEWLRYNYTFKIGK